MLIFDTMSYQLDYAPQILYTFDMNSEYNK